MDLFDKLFASVRTLKASDDFIVKLRGCLNLFRPSTEWKGGKHLQHQNINMIRTLLYLAKEKRSLGKDGR